MDELYRVAIIILRGMWNHRWIGLATTWVAGLLGFAIVAVMPENYEASARIFVNTDSILRPLMTGVTVAPNDDQRIAMLSRIVISRPNVERLVKEVRLDEKAQTREQRDAIVDQATKRLKFFSVGRDANVYSITFRDRSPERAKKAIEVLAGIFMDQSTGNKSADTEQAKRFIDEQIGVYEQKLREAESRLKEFRTTNLGMAPGEGRTDYFARMAEAERQLNHARLELREAERSREALRAGLQNAEANVSEGAPVASELDGRIDAMRRQLDSQLQKFTEEHPDVQGTRRMLAELEAQRAQYKVARRPGAPAGRGVAVDQLRVSLAQSEASVAALTARVAEYTARHERLKGSASLVPKLEAELAQLNRDYDVNKRNYELLVSKRESAAITGEMQAVAGVVDFRMVDPPRVSPYPVFPNRAALFPLALLMSLGAGVGAAYLARELRPSFYDGRSLRDATGLPLLGVVSLNVTEETRAQRRRGTVRFLGGVGAFVGSFIAGVIAFQLMVKGLL
jgi:polysaccharide chain length determinant protein (PEP-CTERM system associated)